MLFLITNSKKNTQCFGWIIWWKYRWLEDIINQNKMALHYAIIVSFTLTFLSLEVTNNPSCYWKIFSIKTDAIYYTNQNNKCWQLIYFLFVAVISYPKWITCYKELFTVALTFLFYLFASTYNVTLNKNIFQINMWILLHIIVQCG